MPAAGLCTEMCQVSQGQPALPSSAPIAHFGGCPPLALAAADQALEVNRVWLWLVGNYWALTTVATVRRPLP